MTAMKPITVLIVDDEPLAAERLANLIDEMPNINVLAKVGNAQQAWDFVQKHQPDVLLLDISMPGMSGLEFAKSVNSIQKPPCIIFCTAHEQHALQAFEAQAFDYLVKPVRRERLQESFKRVIRQIHHATEHSIQQFMVVSVGGVMRRISLQEVFFLHADEKYTVVNHRGGEHILDEPLKELEQRYQGQFFRIHRNCLVKVEQLHEIRRDADGQTWAVLKDWPKALEISRRCASELKDIFKHK